MDRFQTGLCDCFKSEHTTDVRRVVNTSRWVTLKAFFCPCILLGENTQRPYPLNDRTRCTARVGTVSGTSYSTRSRVCSLLRRPPYLDICTLGAYALHASERDALAGEFDITTEPSSAETFLKATLCLLRARTRVARITIRQHLESTGLLYEPPQPVEML